MKKTIRFYTPQEKKEIRKLTPDQIADWAKKNDRSESAVYGQRLKLLSGGSLTRKKRTMKSTAITFKTHGKTFSIAPENYSSVIMQNDGTLVISR